MNLLTMYRGDDRPFLLVVKDKDTGQVADITGCSAVWTWKENKGDASYFLQKSANLTDPEQGEAEFNIDATDTESLREERIYFWDVELTKATGKKETLCEGKIRILMDVTR